MSKTNAFAETLIDYVDGAIRSSVYGVIQGQHLVLGGASGPGGGSGQPWGGVVGQLAQRLVCYDTTEAAIPTTVIPSSSLVDNLNHIRWHHLPATWYETMPTEPRSMQVTVASGLWYDGENSYISRETALSPIFTAPTANPRIDILYLPPSGVMAIQEGVEAAVPSITMPTASGVLPLAAIYLEPAVSAICWPSGHSVYSGYIYRDMRPFITYPGGGAALTVRDQDGVPTVHNVSEIRFTDGTVTNEGGGAVSVVVSGGGGGAPTDAQYLTLALDGSLTGERRFVPGTWLEGTDAGANADYTVAWEPDKPICVSAGVATEYNTIQLAINAAGVGDSVLVPPGTYNEDITLKANVCIKGLGPKDRIRITGDDSFVTTAANGWLENVTLVQTVTGGADRVIDIAHAAGPCEMRNITIISTCAINSTARAIKDTAAGTLTIEELVVNMTFTDGYPFGIDVRSGATVWVKNFVLDLDSSDPATGCCAIYCSNGTATLIEGQIETSVVAGDAWDLYEDGGNIEVHAVQYDYDKVFGSEIFLKGDRVPKVTPDDYWHGLGSGGGRIIYDSTPAPDELNFADCESHWDNYHDVYPDDSGRGIWARIINRRGISTYDWHFRVGDPAPPTGYTWQGAPFVAAVALQYARANDYMMAVSGGAGQRSFMSIPVANLAAAWLDKSIYARIRTGATTQVGVRFDDGTDTDYAEILMTGAAADATQNLIFVTRIGGGAVNTVVSNLTIPVDNFITVRLYCRFLAPNYWAYGYVCAEDGEVVNIAGCVVNMGAGGFPAAGRVGVIYKDQGNYGSVDWIYEDFG